MIQLPPIVEILRFKTIKRIQDIIQYRYGRQYTVEAFGSTRYGVSLPSSDLDLVIIVSDQFRFPVVLCYSF